MTDIENKLPQITGYATGFYKSGNYGGSTEAHQFPNVYHYTRYSISENENQELNLEFQELMTLFLDKTYVNNIVTLREYLAYRYTQNNAKLLEINNTPQPKKSVGNTNQPLPYLFFTKDRESPFFELDPYSTTLTFDADTVNRLNTFLKDHGVHFKNQIPDQFLTDFYERYLL
ncbi:MAG: hypothetical protein U1C58_01815 [Flavobacteriaceae bacterium]|nr:hypothetical protein [Flavobacteriaceae bacterium]MDZ4147000.1 hypothetical protein [Flavobacteriaceae bacterium]